MVSTTAEEFGCQPTSDSRIKGENLVRLHTKTVASYFSLAIDFGTETVQIKAES